MPKPVYLLTVHEAHKELQLPKVWSDLGFVWAFRFRENVGQLGTPAFNAECSERWHI